MEQRKHSLQRLILGVALLVSTPLFAEQIGVSSFKYLNNNDNSLTIDANEAQDLLNVDIRPGGKSVKKREGYGVYKALAGGTGGVHGGHHFLDSTGNDVQLWGANESLYSFVAGGSQTQLVSSATLNTTWDCADTQGYAYCVTSSRNAYIKTDGATILWYTSPLGTMVEITPERAVVSGVSGSPNTLYFSEPGVFTNFTTGLAETSPFTEVIASPGSKITHIRYGCGKLLWWKDKSFGYLTGSTQFDIENTIVSDNIGTFDNTSVIDPGGSVWFRGHDGHVWRYDCTSLTKESIDISPVVQTSGRRVSNHWTQTSEAEFDDGAISPSGSLNNGSGSNIITVTSFTATDTSDANYNAGARSSITVTGDSYRLSRDNLRSVANNSFESGSGYTPDSWTGVYGGRDDDVDVSQGCNGALTGKSGTYYGDFAYQLNTFNPRLVVSLIDNHTSATLQSQTYLMTAQNCAFTDQTFSVSSAHYGKSAYLKFLETDDHATSVDGSLQTSSPYIVGGDVTFAMAISVGSNYRTAPIDNVRYGFSSISSGTFTSQVFDTNLPHSQVLLTANWDVNSATPSFVLQKSSSATGRWAAVSASTGSSVAVDQRYVRYLSTLTAENTDNALSAVNDVTFLARSSGTFYSVVQNAPNIVMWDTYNANQALNDGTITHYTRASNSNFTTQSSTPAWVSQTNGAVVAASTGTYYQAKIEFGVTSAQQTPTVNDFTFNWFEGTATDQAYGTYFDNAIWFSVAYGLGVSTNNYIFKYDLINEGWTLYNFGAGGFAIQNNNLYFGQSYGYDNIFRYGGTTSDNGAAFVAFWKSKDYPGQDPFLQNTYDQLDTLWTENSGHYTTVTYTLDTATEYGYAVNLTSSTQSIINHRKLLPGRLGYTFNVSFYDNSITSAWELLGYRFSFSPQPYRPSR